MSWSQIPSSLLPRTRSAARSLLNLHVRFMRRRLMETGCDWDEHLRHSTVLLSSFWGYKTI